MKRFLGYKERNEILIKKGLPSRVCGRCGNELPTKDFTPSPKKPGGYYCLCKSCILKHGTREKTSSPSVKTLGQKKLYNGATDLSVFKDIPKFAFDGFSLRKAKLLVGAMQEYIAWRGEKRQKDLFKQYLPEHSYATCMQVKTELTKAARAGMTLEEYYLKNRPFRAGKKVLIEGK